MFSSVASSAAVSGTAMVVVQSVRSLGEKRPLGGGGKFNGSET